MTGREQSTGGTNQYRIEAKVKSEDAAYILREIIEDNVDCRLAAFERLEDTGGER